MKIKVLFASNILALLGLMVKLSARDAGIQTKIHSSEMTTLITSNKEMNVIMNFVKVPEDEIENETKDFYSGFSEIPLDTLSTLLLGIMLIGKGSVIAGYDNKRNSVKQGDGIVRAVYGF